jgi:hypothetical protein
MHDPEMMVCGRPPERGKRAELLNMTAIFGVSFFAGPASVTAFSRNILPEASWGRSVTPFTTAFAIGQALGPVAGLIADIAQSPDARLGGRKRQIAAAVAGFQRPLTR